METNSKEFGKCVKKHRVAKGYTQQVLADLLDVQPKSISYIERGLNYPTTEKLFRLAVLLDISLDEFIYGVSRFDRSLTMKELNKTLDSVPARYRSLLISIINSAANEIIKNT